MRQLLMLGFYCEVYRREPLCRVYANDMLLDEFNIPHTYKKNISKEKVNVEILDPAFLTFESYISKSSFPFYKIIELDDNSKEIDIKIEIQNNDNNYANGFMSKYTRVVLTSCHLSSRKVLDCVDRIKHKRQKWFKQEKDYRKFLHRYFLRKDLIFNNFAQYVDLCFPNIFQKQISQEQLKLYHSNYKDLPVMWELLPDRIWIGGSGYFHLKLKKKLGFWRHKTSRLKGFWKIGAFDIIEYLYDKYKHYENTRSIDT